MHRLRKCIEGVFDEPLEKVIAIGEFSNSEDWDSLKYVALVVGIQAEFEVDLTPDEVQSITSVAALEQLLVSRGLSP
ncbi:MAG: acyl carrier protein [Gammaproteobacteria bacterium]|nr:acyl carrier protein [Gammaproteobacteria bacterium]MBI5616596.1 acyl carrier protein [Gammaproteobacteria bacterium]